MLWIAFKKLYLWYSEQLKFFHCFYVFSCELLSKNCIFDILNNKATDEKREQEVVNCFQKIVSLIFWTTKWSAASLIASCELLSKNCIFDILNNIHQRVNKYDIVVNCFQKIVSLIFWTTSPCATYPTSSLWIAFKKLYLWYSEQRWLK